MDKNISDTFHREYECSRLWEKTSWLGVPIWKLPMDAFIIQELIFRVKPDYVVETGTNFGGSSLFYASILQLIGNGSVITVDIEDKAYNMPGVAQEIMDERVIQLIGDSVEKFSSIQKCCAGRKCIVILDSWHSKEHVAREMDLYHTLVTAGSYMIVEDTHVSGHPIEWKWGEGPYEAVKEFCMKHPNFEPDLDCERLGITFNPQGYLKKLWD